MAYLAMFVGALVAVFLLSRLFGFATTTLRSRLFADLIATVVAVLLGAIGGADGGPLAFDAIWTYGPAGLVVMAYDYWRSTGQSPETEQVEPVASPSDADG